jgi:glutamate-1-semialdehyde 2,1-aminomutase
VAVAAGLATLRELRESAGPYERLERIGATAEGGLVEVLRETGVVGCVNRVGSMMTLFFGISSARNFRDVSRADTQMFAGFFRGMLEAGFYLPPSQFEAMFWSLAHDEGQARAFVDAARQVLREIAR